MSDMRDRVLAAAVQVVRTQGVARATTREIAQAAGVSEGSIFHHFPSKADLLRAVFTEGIDNPMPNAMQRLWTDVGSGDLRDHLTDLAVAAIHFYREVLPLSGPQLVHRTELDEARSGLPDHFGPIIGHENLTRFLSIEQRLGRLAAGTDPAVLALTLLGSCQQYAFLALTSTPDQLDASAAALSSDPATIARRVVDQLVSRPDTGTEDSP